LPGARTDAPSRSRRRPATRARRGGSARRRCRGPRGGRPAPPSRADDALARDRPADHQLPRLEPRPEAHHGTRLREAAADVVADPQVVRRHRRLEAHPPARVRQQLQEARPVPELAVHGAELGRAVALVEVPAHRIVRRPLRARCGGAVAVPSKVSPDCEKVLSLTGRLQGGRQQEPWPSPPSLARQLRRCSQTLS